MSDTFNFEDFESQLNQAFQIEGEPGQWIPATLIEASELGYRYAEADRGQPKAFSLLFRGGADVHLTQQIYTVKNDALGENRIFLVPLQPDEDGSYYEAVFT